MHSVARWLVQVHHNYEFLHTEYDTTLARPAPETAFRANRVDRQIAHAPPQNNAVVHRQLVATARASRQQQRALSTTGDLPRTDHHQQARQENQPSILRPPSP